MKDGGMGATKLPDPSFQTKRSGDLESMLPGRVEAPKPTPLKQKNGQSNEGLPVFGVKPKD